jgi:hypothetical protein
MGRKRPWQVITCLVLPDENKINSKSFLTHEEALAWGAEWMQAHGPDNPFRPSVEIAHRDSRDWPEDELAPESYRLEWAPEHKALLQVTWPAKTPNESMDQTALAMGRAMQGEPGAVRRLLKVIAVAPGGDEALIGRDLGVVGGI